MTDYRDAVDRRAPAITTTGNGEPRSRGHVIAYTDEPQVCIEYPDGHKEWWLARLTAVDPGPPTQAAQDRPRRDNTPTAGGTDGQDAPDASTGRLRVLAEAHAHEADRLAHTTAGITHALLAHFWLNNAQEQPR